MLLVYGADRGLLDRITADHPATILDELSFDSAEAHPGATLLYVEAVPRAGDAPPEPGSLAAFHAAAQASLSRVIIVTSRRNDDDDLRRLRRSGARYVIVRPPPVVDVEALRGKRVLVPRDAADAELVTLDDLVKAVDAVLADELAMGQTIDVPPSGLAALEAVGATARVVAPWRAKLGRWLRQPVLALQSPRASRAAPAGA